MFGVGKLCVNQLVSMYLNENDVDRALNFLLGLDWHSDGPFCLTTLQQITNYLFRLPFTPVREGIAIFHELPLLLFIIYNKYSI